MDPFKKLLEEQYRWAREARKVLFDFCATMAPDRFVRVSPDVGNGGSIRSLMIHVCDTYYGWLTQVGLQRPFHKIDVDAFSTLEDCVACYAKTDELMIEFLDRYEHRYQEPITTTVAGHSVISSPFQLFTHVITHESHHKGQMLTLSRMWGYQPVDTDIIRT